MAQEGLQGVIKTIAFTTGRRDQTLSTISDHDGKHEEQKGQQVALSKASSMLNQGPSDPVKENPGKR